jgi:hypothetical protein
MDIKKLVSISIVMLCSFLSNTYAGQSNDLCSKIPGHWQGIYTIKDQETCKLYNGCTHLVMADVSYISNNEYHLNLNPVVGEGGEFNIQCDNGAITSPIPGSKATISCNTLNQCYVLYDDPRLTSEMMKS